MRFVKKKTQFILRMMLVLTICYGFIALFSSEANAATNSYKTIKTGSCYLKSGTTYEIPFSTTKKLIFVMDVQIDDTNYPTEGGLQIILKKRDSDINIQNDKSSLAYESAFYSWYVSDGYFQDAGQYTYYIINTSDEDWRIKYKLVSYSKVAKKASMKKKASGKSENWIKIGKVGPGYPGWGKSIKSVSFSNKKIVKYFDNGFDGNIYIMGKKRGTTTVTLKMKSGKKYTTKVTFKPLDPNFFAQLWNYNTRDNYFTVRIKNNGASDLTIIRNGAYVENYDYKNFDRDVKSAENVTIKPGKTKYVKFYLRGGTTWYKYSDFRLLAKFRYEGETKVWKVTSGNSTYKKNSNKKDWYYTYWSSYEEDFEDWYM